MNPAIAEALADLVMSIHSAPTRKGDALCVALGLDADAPWDDVAAALLALARPDVGLPEGWTDGGSMRCKGGETLYTAYGPGDCYARLEIWPSGAAAWSYCGAPPAAYLHLLRAAGVAS